MIAITQNIIEDKYSINGPMEKQLKKEWKNGKKKTYKEMKEAASWKQQAAIAISKKKKMKEDHIPIAMGKMLDSEGGMIKNQIETIQRSCELLRAQIKSDDMQIPAWVQAKVTLATENILTCANYMAGKDEEVKEEVEKITERDEGKPGLNFKKIAKKAAAEYGSKEAGNRVAGAIRKKVLAKEEVEEIAEVKMDGKDDNGFKSCWKGYKKQGTKVKGDKEVNNCVKAGYEMEEGEELQEKRLSAKEKAKKEKFVKGMKKKFSSMKSKYGSKAQNVMFGAATNMAKKAA